VLQESTITLQSPFVSIDQYVLVSLSVSIVSLRNLHLQIPLQNGGAGDRALGRSVIMLVSKTVNDMYHGEFVIIEKAYVVDKMGLGIRTYICTVGSESDVVSETQTTF
jgi:hypothetical protein